MLGNTLALTQMPACSSLVPTDAFCGSLLPNSRPAAMTFRTGPKQICAGMSRRASSTSLPRCWGASCSPAYDSLRRHRAHNPRTLVFVSLPGCHGRGFL